MLRERIGVNQFRTWEHRASLTLVDGRRHRPPKRQTCERTVRATEADKQVAQQIEADFDALFQLRGDGARFPHLRAVTYALVTDPSQKNSLQESEHRMREMKAVQCPVEPALPSDQLRDFITTLRGGEPRAVFETVSTSQASEESKHPPGCLPEARFLPSHALYVVSKTRAHDLFITSLPASSVIHHPEGTTLWRGEVLLAARLPDVARLPQRITDDLLRIYFQLETIRPFLVRGADVANVCQNFVITGLKCDNNSRLCLPHVHSDQHTQTQARMAWNKLRKVFIRYVLPPVLSHLGPFFLPLLAWIRMRGLPMYAQCVSAATFGRLYWPRQHTDPDAWYTILVCLDIRRGVVGGGDFAFARTGHVLRCSHGDILVFNGLELHGATEFHVPHKNDGRVFVAFFLKKDSLRASALSLALFRRTGVHSLALDDVLVE